MVNIQLHNIHQSDVDKEKQPHMDKLIRGIYDFVVSSQVFTPHTHYCHVVFLVPTPLVVIHVLILSTFIGDVSTPLLVRCGTLSDTSKSSVVSIMFCGL